MQPGRTHAVFDASAQDDQLLQALFYESQGQGFGPLGVEFVFWRLQIDPRGGDPGAMNEGVGRKPAKVFPRGLGHRTGQHGHRR